MCCWHLSCFVASLGQWWPTAAPHGRALQSWWIFGTSKPWPRPLAAFFCGLRWTIYVGTSPVATTCWHFWWLLGYLLFGGESRKVYRCSFCNIFGIFQGWCHLKVFESTYFHASVSEQCLTLTPSPLAFCSGFHCHSSRHLMPWPVALVPCCPEHCVFVGEAVPALGRPKKWGGKSWLSSMYARKQHWRNDRHRERRVDRRDPNPRSQLLLLGLGMVATAGNGSSKVRMVGSESPNGWISFQVGLFKGF